MKKSSSFAYQFDAGTLMASSAQGSMSIIAWPVPSTVWQFSDGKQESRRPEFRLVYPVGQEPCPALADFRKCLPDKVARILEPFASHQWNLLELMAARPEAIQLASHNPVLAYLLANNDHFRKNLTKPPVYLAQWRLDYNQERLLEWLGFPAKAAVVKLFRRLLPSAISLNTARILKINLNDEQSPIELLAHHQRINRGMLSLVLLPKLRPYLTTELLTEVAGLPDGNPTDDPGEKLVPIFNTLFDLGCMKHVKPIRSLKQLNQLLTDAKIAQAAELAAGLAARTAAQQAIKDRLQAEDRVLLAKQRRIERLSLLTALPPDTNDIVRLKKAFDFIDEGNKQKNCVGRLTEQAALGRVILYKVLNPERATLALRMHEDGRWRIGELKTACNGKASRTTLWFVMRWLAKHSRCLSYSNAQKHKRSPTPRS
jgi:hypothetical protein